MAHNHHHDSGDNGMGFLFGVILLIAFAFVLWYWGVPAVREVKEGTQINVPSQIDVNVKQEQPQY